MSTPNQLSFLPDDYLDLKVQRRTNFICATLFAVVVSGAGAACRIAEKAITFMETENARVSRQYADAAEPIERFKKMQEQQKRMEAHAALSASLLEKVPRSYVLAEVTKSLPPNVSLLDFVLDARPRNTGPAIGQYKTIYEQKKAEIEAGKVMSAPKAFDVTFKLTGMADNDVQVAAFMNQLAKSKLFRDVNLVVSDEFQASPKDASQRKFVIEMVLPPDAEVKPAEPVKNTKYAEVDSK